MHSLKTVWQKLVYSISVLSLFAMFLSPVAVGRTNFGSVFTPNDCDTGTLCSK